MRVTMNMDYMLDSERQNEQMKSVKGKVKKGSVTRAVIFIWICVISLLLLVGAGVFAIFFVWIFDIAFID